MTLYPALKQRFIANGRIDDATGEWTDEGKAWLDVNFDGITPRTQRPGLWPNDEQYPDFAL
jgi:hypothetical protein